MKFQKLTIRNFLTIGEAEPIGLEDKGLVLIQGVNEDDSSATSNGVGKSSIPDALCWVIYGVTARGETGDAVVNNVVKKDTRVEVVIQDGSSGYRITRYRKDKEHKNQLFVEGWSDASPGVTVDMSKGTEKETQEVVNAIMGCSVEVFMAAIYAGQEEMPDLPRMTDKHLKLLIEEAAGVERLEEAYALARKDLDAAKQEVGRLTFEQEGIKRQLGGILTRIAAAKFEFDEFEAGRMVRRDAHVSAADASYKSMCAVAGDIRSVDEAALVAELADIDAKVARQEQVRLKHKSLTGCVATAQMAEARAQLNVKQVISQIKSLKSLYDNAEEEQKKPCPTCGHTVEGGHRVEEYRAHIRQKIAENVAELNALKSTLEKAREEVAQRQKEADDFEATIPNFGELAPRRRELESELRKVNDLKNLLRTTKRDYDMHKEHSESVMVVANPNQKVLDMLAADEKAALESIAAIEAKLVASEEEVAVAESVVKVFGPAGVRAHILDTVTPFLNERTSEYLSALSDGNITAVWSTLAENSKGELREKFNIDVEHAKGGKSFKLLSGGEKRKVRVSTMLALQDLVASRATKPIDLWIGDEIDDALDGAGLERLMGVLENKARERGTVLIVSHNELRDWVDNVATVTKRGGMSVIEGALCE